MYHFSWFGVFTQVMHCVTLTNAEILYNSVIPSEIISFFGGMLTFSKILPRMNLC